MKKLLLLFLLLSFTAVAQRTLPYPIIFVHGLAGSDESWYEFADYLRSTYGLVTNTLYYVNSDGKPTGKGRANENSRLSFNLNYDNNLYSSNAQEDYADLVDESKLSNNDIYIINFQTGKYSNQSAIYKQGIAIRDAIKHVRSVTGADKVIIMAHSMGGLAARDYLQNPQKWQADGQHHIAKLITVGTPHGGSDGSLGPLVFVDKIDELSEAVRDLRATYLTATSGLYLYGGYENSIVVRGALWSFNNVDVNCNGKTGDQIEGLNKRPTMPANLAFASVIGVGITTTPYFSDGDGVVESSKANLANYYQVTQDVFYAYKQNSGIAFQTHTDLCKTYPYENLQALDEPGTRALAYEIDITDTRIKRGFFSAQANKNQVDSDKYKFFVAQAGILSVAAEMRQEANAGLTILNADGGAVAFFQGPSIKTTIRLPAGGTYYADFTGNAANLITSYGFATSFCPLPDAPTIVSSAPTTFCEGGQVTLSTAGGLANYVWLKDGQFATSATNSNSFAVSQAGTYALQTVACGITISSANSVSVRVNPVPASPVITLQNQPFGLLATNATNYQWYHNGQKINNATGPILSAVSAGPYTVRTTVSGCSSESLPFVVTGVEPDPAELVRIQPNPTDGYFSVELPTQTTATIELLDLLGRRVFTQSDKAKSTLKTIDARPIAPGVYIITIRFDEKEVSSKLIVK